MSGITANLGVSAEGKELGRMHRNKALVQEEIGKTASVFELKEVTKY